jgi:ubiquinone/menaquinone biosynthesis C-methylase UbiE
MTDIDPQRFHDFEQAGWEAVAGNYNNSWAWVTTQSIEPLLNAAGVGKGTRVLDVACGPGYVAGAARSRGAIATGIDFSAAMILEAQCRYPDVDFRQGDAEDLAFSEATFDALVCNFGLLHLARPERALAEFHRVLAPGSRIAFTVWDKPDRAVGHGIVIQAIQAHGDLHVPIPPGPPFFRFSDPEESKQTLTAAGFVAVDVARVDQLWRLPSADALFDVMFNSSVRNTALLKAQKPEALQAIREFMRREVQAGSNVLPMPAVLVSANR